MSQVEYVTGEKRGWWNRLFDNLIARPEGEMNYELPADSLFADAWTGGTNSVADVPDQIKAQIREEAVLDTFNRLEASLRLLLYATTPGKEPPTADRCHQILNVWRYELEHRVHLTPDTYCGAVQRYEMEMESSYTIDGRCEQGDLLRIRVPCWRMYDRVVIRGEAELLNPEEEEEANESAPAGEAPAMLMSADLPAEEEEAELPRPARRKSVKAEPPAAESIEAAPEPQPEAEQWFTEDPEA